MAVTAAAAGQRHGAAAVAAAGALVEAAVDLSTCHLLQCLHKRRHSQRHVLVLVDGPDLVEGICSTSHVT
jgi:hypothetical protein